MCVSIKMLYTHTSLDGIFQQYFQYFFNRFEFDDTNDMYFLSHCRMLSKFILMRSDILHVFQLEKKMLALATH